jgi:RHS repeat-associated protein
VVTNSSGAQYGYTRYYPYGSTRSSSGSLDTDKKFTGQRLDGTGLYYYGARYYDPTIGRFISADPIVPNPANPQSLNRYSYCLNNPLRYVDPSGHQQIDWGCDASGQPLAPPASAFGPGGYYGGQYGRIIDYNSYTTVGGPPVCNWEYMIGCPTPAPTPLPITAIRMAHLDGTFTFVGPWGGDIGAHGDLSMTIRSDFTAESLTVSIDAWIDVTEYNGLYNIQPNIYLHPSPNNRKIELNEYSCLGPDTCWKGSATTSLSTFQPYVEVYVSAFDSSTLVDSLKRTQPIPAGYRVNLVTGDCAKIWH